MADHGWLAGEPKTRDSGWFVPQDIAYEILKSVRGRVGRETGVGGSEESRSWVNGIHGRG